MVVSSCSSPLLFLLVQLGASHLRQEKIELLCEERKEKLLLYSLEVEEEIYRPKLDFVINGIYLVKWKKLLFGPG